ncbi:unnamed protein product [Lactuca saligna]|uniref:Uncharacterized protein n=1 Tax=Lactuca saligna TaxID=75948 RepID=A0AA35Z334_LACSI|nr:unnamed protein product [Lactuca saligna]
MNGSNMWPTTEYIPYLPPMKRRIPGMLTMKRIRDASERPRKNTISKARKMVSYGIYKQIKHNKSTCTQVERRSEINVRKKQKVRQRQELVNMQGCAEDDVMIDKVEQQGVRDNEDEKVVRVNEDVEYDVSVVQASKRKKTKRILKMKLAKRVQGEGSSATTAMNLD